MTTLEEYYTVPDYLEEDFNNILYVDDEDSNLRVFDSVFCRYYNIYTANNGKRAIEMLREHEIHMIITDQKMPEMTGTDLLEKTLEEFPDIIRIILTGFADIQAIIKAINKCSIYKYITKPYENSEIKEIIDKGLEIYNMRLKKYNGEALNGVEHNGHSIEEDGLAKLEPESKLDTIALAMVQDVLPSEVDYEAYFDFHIDYRLHEDELPEIYSDFVVFADNDGSRLFHVTMKTTTDTGGAMVYMHMKSKLRALIEIDGTSTKLQNLAEELVTVYEEFDLPFIPEDLKIMSYDWDSGDFQYLSTQKNIKAYTISEKLEPLDLKKTKGAKKPHTLYKAKTSENLMVYFWDYNLSEGGDVKESDEHFKQIISHATSIPFDMQQSQIERGVKSVSKHFTDAVVHGLYLNE